MQGGRANTTHEATRKRTRKRRKANKKRCLQGT